MAYENPHRDIVAGDAERRTRRPAVCALLGFRTRS